MIGTIHHIKIPKEYITLFDTFYRVFAKSDHFGKVITYREPDYSFAMFEASPLDTDTVLDVGCACSFFVICLARFAKKVYGIDMIESYAKKWALPWLETMNEFEDFRSGKVEIVNANAAILPFDDASFDKVYTFSALEHFTDDDDSLCAAEVSRVLKPGGVFIGTVDYNEAVERPRGDQSICRTYTHEAFVRRILEPSGLQMTNCDFLKDRPKVESVSYISSTLFFKLVKK